VRWSEQEEEKESYWTEEEKVGCYKAQETSKAEEMPILWRRRPHGEGMWVYCTGEANECHEGSGCGTQVVEQKNLFVIGNNSTFVIGNNSTFVIGSEMWVEHTYIRH
jgi:hypothetical protein